MRILKKGQLTPDINRGRISVDGEGDWWFFITDIKHILMPFLLFNHPVDLYQIKNHLVLSQDKYKGHPFAAISDGISGAGLLLPIGPVLLGIAGLITLHRVHIILNALLMITVGFTTVWYYFSKKGIKHLRVAKKRRAIIHVPVGDVVAKTIIGLLLNIIWIFVVIAELFDKNTLAVALFGFVLAFAIALYDAALVGVDDEVQVEFLDEKKSKEKQELEG